MVLLERLLISIWLCSTMCAALSSGRPAQRSPRTKDPFFTKQLIIPALPGENPKYGLSMPVCYTNSPESAALWLEEFIPSTADSITVGFDVESVPNVPWLKTKFQGPATVQISVPESTLVVQLVDGNGNPSDASVPLLKAFLADETIVKAGVGIDQDMLELYREWGSDEAVRGRCDIGGIGSEEGRTVALKTLTDAVVQVELQKSKKLAVSNWGQVPLRDAQIAYCARDAWAAAAVMRELANRDPEVFSTESMMAMCKEELPIEELDVKARDRKEARMKFLAIVGKGDDRIAVKDLPDDLKKQVDELQETIRELAPPKAFHFDLSPLGIKL